MVNNCKYCLIEIEYPKRNNCHSEKCLKLMKSEQDKRNREKRKGSIVVANYRKRYQNKHRIRVLARRKTRNIGEKDNICFLCESKETQFHHLSYSPNISMELCKSCHNYIHNESKVKIHIVRFCRDLKRKNDN